MKVCHIPSLKLTSLLAWLFVYRGPPGYLLASSVPLLNLTVPQSLPCPPLTKTWQGNFIYLFFLVWVDYVLTNNILSSLNFTTTSSLNLKHCFSAQMYGACQYLAARCHVSDQIHTCQLLHIPYITRNPSDIGNGLELQRSGFVSSMLPKSSSRPWISWMQRSQRVRSCWTEVERRTTGHQSQQRTGTCPLLL